MHTSTNKMANMCDDCFAKKLLQKSELSKYHINYVCRAVTSDSYSRKILAGSVKTSWSKLVRRTGEIVRRIDDR